MESVEDTLFKEEFEGRYPRLYSNFLGRCQRISKRITEITDYRLLATPDIGIDCQDINKRHKVDFVGDVIPATISRVRSEDPCRKVRVLDLGCGMALAADQIRAMFGKDVIIFGTSLEKKSTRHRKKNLIHQLRNNVLQVTDQNGIKLNMPITDEIRDQILHLLGRELNPTGNERQIMHPNDGKWRTILELKDYPEFDLIIDTFGELCYASEISFHPEDFFCNFVKIFHAAIRKLRKDGQLFIADLSVHQALFLKLHQEELEKECKISIQWRLPDDGHNTVVIRKF